MGVSNLTMDGVRSTEKKNRSEKTVPPLRIKIGVQAKFGQEGNLESTVPQNSEADVEEKMEADPWISMFETELHQPNPVIKLRIQKNHDKWQVGE